MSKVKLSLADLKSLIANAQAIGNEAKCLPLMLEWAEGADTEIQRLRAQLVSIRQKLSDIVVTEGEDAGIVLLSYDGPTHYDEHLDAQVYDHEYFSPLGDALMELYKLTQP